MKIIQAAVLVLVGALGAMLFLKVKGGPELQIPVTAAPAEQVARPTPPDPPAVPAAEPAVPAPVRTAKKNSQRTVTVARRDSQPVPITETKPNPLLL